MNELTYLVCKEKGGKFFVAHKDTPSKPISGSFGDKKHALHFAAAQEGLTYKDYLKYRKD